MSRRSDHSLPWWLTSRHVPLAWSALAMIILLLAVGFLAFQRAEFERERLARIELYVKIVDEQVTRTLSAADIAMRAVADALDVQGRLGAPHDHKTTAALLRDAIAPLPILKSLSVIDADHHVVASSNVRAVGTRVDGLLSTWPGEQGTLQSGPLLSGIDLAPAQWRNPGSGSHFLPVVRRLATADESPRYLVGVFNLGQLVSQFGLVLNQEEEVVGALLSVNGQILVSSTAPDAPDSATLRPGRSAASHPLFAAHSVARPHGSFVTEGLTRNKVISAYRELRPLPLIAVVEQSYSVIDREVEDRQKWVGAMIAIACLMLGAVALLARRSLRHHEVWSAALQQASQALIASESRKWAVMSAALDAVVTIDSSGCVVDFNPAAEGMFGRTLLDVAGRPFDEVVVPADRREGYGGRFLSYSETGEAPTLNRRVELEVLRADGSPFPVELTMVPVQAGGEAFFAATLRDISERRRIEDERAAMLRNVQMLAADLERQKFALDEHAIVSIADARGRITYANARLLSISGYTLTELLGKDHSVLKSARQPDVIFDTLWRCISQGQVWHGELVNERNDGRAYWVACTIVPVPGDDGCPREYISIQTDISALREAQLALGESRRSELAIGARIQQSLLVTPPPAELAGLWLSAFNQASQGIDGDFIEIIRTGERYVDLIAGDVMGKGLPAALMGAATKLQISRSIAELISSAPRGEWLPEPAEIVSAVHRAMTPNLQRLEAFVTLCYVRFDRELGQVTWVGCGHEEAVLHRRAGTLQVLANQHPPLGVLDDTLYTQNAIGFDAGDMILLYSDGVTDARRIDGERVGRHRLVNAFCELRSVHNTPASILHSLRRDLLSGDVEKTDDVTLALIESVDSARCAHRTELAVQVEAILELRAFVTSLASLAGLTDQAVALFEVAVVEAFSNVVQHATGIPHGSVVEVVVCRSDDRFEVDLVHLGDAFEPPISIGEVDLSRYPEGGFGLSIISAACDEVQYLRAGGVNTIRLTKCLSNGWQKHSTQGLAAADAVVHAHGRTAAGPGARESADV